MGTEYRIDDEPFCARGDGIPGYKRVENVYGGDRIVYFYNDFDYHA